MSSLHGRKSDLGETTDCAVKSSVLYIRLTTITHRTLSLDTPITESPSSIDIHGVKRDLDKKALVHIVPFNTEFYGR